MEAQARTFDAFTVQAKLVLSQAQREAQQWGQNELGPEHLLLGIIALPESSAVRILRELGTGPERLRASLGLLLRPGDQVSGEVKLAQQTKDVIAAAVAEAQNLQHPYPGVGHLLLGILHVEESVACGLLLQQGVSLQRARAAFVQLSAQMPAEQFAPVVTPSEHFGDWQPATSSAPRENAPFTINSERQQQAVAMALSRQKFTRIYLLAFVCLLAVVFLLAQDTAVVSNLIYQGILFIAFSPLASVLIWQPVAGWYPVVVSLGVVLLLLVVALLVWPLSWYSGFVISRRYGLRKDTTLSWLADMSKQWLLGSIQVWLFVELSTLLIDLQPQTWWLWAALAQFLFSLLLARLTGRWLMPRLNKITPLMDGPLFERLQMLLVRLQLPPCRFCQVHIGHKTQAVNAFFLGWGGGRLVLLTDTLIQHFTLDEIEVILAHELGHLVHHDIWTRLVMRGLTVLGLLYTIHLLLFMNGVSAQPWLSLVQPLLPFLLIILYLVLLIVIMRYRRYQEYQADEFALQATGKVSVFKAAMVKLTEINMLVAVSTKRARHPATHPTLLKRLQHADEFATRQTVQNNVSLAYKK